MSNNRNNGGPPRRKENGHENPNPRYKGKNYDPNYNPRKNQTFQEYIRVNNGGSNQYDYDAPNFHNQYSNNRPPLRQGSTSPNIDPNSPPWSQHQKNKHNRQNQQSQYQQPPYQQPPFQQPSYQQPSYQQPPSQQPPYQQSPYQQPPYQQPQYEQPQHQQPQFQGVPSDDIALQFLERLGKGILDALHKDREGDVRMCSCERPGNADCVHGLAAVLGGHVLASAYLQYDIVDLLTFLMSKHYNAEEAFQGWLAEYLEDNPDTPLLAILQTMGSNGLVNVGATSLGSDGGLMSAVRNDGNIS